MEGLSFKEIITNAWRKYEKTKWLCAGTLFVYLCFLVLTWLVESLLAKTLGHYPSKVITFLIVSFASFGVTLIILDISFDKKTNLTRFGDVVDYYPRAISQHILGILAIAVGYVFLIIPGIILQLGFSQTLFLILEKHAGILASFKMSWKLTRGIKWRLLYFNFLFFVINVLGFFCFVIGLFVTIPLTALASVEIYKKLIQNNEANSNTSEGQICHT